MSAAQIVYTTTDPEQAHAILERFGVEYVYVGGLERQQYGTAGLAKFAAFMDAVFENDEVTIYRVRGE
jgi:uncharacterized membrane protein